MPAFDDWASLRRNHVEDLDWRRIDGWARAVDPHGNPWRDAIASNDVGALLTMLEEADWGKIQVGTLARIGEELVEANRIADAVSILSRAQRRFPGDFWIRSQLGDAALRDNQFNVAVQHFDAALATRPRGLQARLRLAVRAYPGRGDEDGGIDTVRQGLNSANEWAEGYAYLGLLLAARGEEQGLPMLKKAVDLAPNNASVHYNYAWYVGNILGEFEEARKEFERAHKIDPRDVMARDAIATMLVRERKFDDAIAVLNDLHRDHPDSIVAMIRLGMAFRNKGDLKNAEDWADRALLLNEKSARALELKTDLLCGRGAIDQALPLARAAVASDPHAAESHAALSRVLTARAIRDRDTRPDGAAQDRQAAIESAQSAIARGRCHIVGHVRLYEAISAKGGKLSDEEWLQAHDAVKELIRVQADDGYYLNSLAVLYMKRGRWKDALPLLERAVAADRAHGTRDQQVAVLSNLLTVHTRLGTPSRMIELLRAYRDDQLEFAPAHRLLGVALARANQPEEAFVHLRKAVDLDRDDARSQMRLGRLYFLTGSHEKGVEHTKIAADLAPDDALAQYSFAAALGRAGRLRKATDQLRVAIRMRPSKWEWHRELHKLLRLRCEFDEALEALREAARLNPRLALSPGIFLCDVMAQYDDAIEEFGKALDVNPEDPWARANLVVALRKRRKYDAAIEASEKLVVTASELPEPRSKRAWTLYRAGRLKEAEAEYRAVLAMDSDLEFVKRNLTRIRAMTEIEKHLDNHETFSPEDAIHAAQLQFVRRRYAESTRFYRQAFAANSALAKPEAGHLLDASRAAARADGDARRHALQWARAIVDWLERNAEPLPRTIALLRIRREPDFASVRDGDNVPAEWKALWARIDQLLEEARS